MKKATKIFAIFAAGILASGTLSCSENLDEKLVPIETTTTLDVTYEDGSEITDLTLDLKAEPSTTVINVESNTRWAVEVSECEGGWCQADVLNNTGNGSFSIKVLENIQQERNCFVNIYKTDAEGNKITDNSKILTIKQAVSDVSLSPSSLEPFPPSGNSRQKFDIVSNVAWTLYVTYEGENPVEFVTIKDYSETMKDNGDGTFSGDGETSFFIEIQDNRTATDRKAYLNLSSKTANYSVEITQAKAEYTFDVSPSENQIVPVGGADITFAVLSLSDWTVKSDYDWISFSSKTGASSDEPVKVTATIAPNLEGSDRTGIIHFIPTVEGYQQQDIVIKQFGGHNAAISVPWLVDGYGQTYATVEFNYYSPYYKIVAGGLQWRKADATDWITAGAEMVPDPNDGTISVELTGLDPATKYVARGYVTNDVDSTFYGTVSLPFTTAGRLPGAGDNPTPLKRR